MPSDRQEKRRREVRYQTSKERQERADKKFEPTAWTVPAGATMFRFAAAKVYRLDFLPYIVTGGNPYCDAGMSTYDRLYFAHRIPTIDGPKLFCCHLKVFGKPCAICEEIARDQRTGKISEKDFEGMDRKKRQFFNIVDLDEAEKGVQILEFNYWQLGRLIDEKTKKERYSRFFTLDEGLTLELEIEEGHFENRKTYKPAEGSLDFVKREKPYGAEWWDKVYDLDRLPKEYGYQELLDIYRQTPPVVGSRNQEEVHEEKNGEQEDKPIPSRNDVEKIKLKGGDLVAGDFVLYDGETMKVVGFREDGRIRLVDRDEDTCSARPEDVTKIKSRENEEQEEKMPSRESLGKLRDKEPEEEDLDLDEDDEETTQPRRRSGKR